MMNEEGMGKSIAALHLVDTLMSADAVGMSDIALMSRLRALSELSLTTPLHLSHPKECHEYYVLFRELYRRKGQKFPFNFIDDFIKNGYTMKPKDT